MKGVIFDMDGVLFDTEALWQKYWNLAAEEAGITLPAQFKKDICGSSDKMPSVVSAYYGVNDPMPIIMKTYGRLQEHLKRELPEKEGLHEALKELREMGFRIAVASSSPTENILANLERSNVREYFDVITSGQEVKNGKPAPDIFLLAAKRLGLPAEECYIFEDAYNGIRAASAAHGVPVMIVDQSEPDEEMERTAHFICRSLMDAVNKIREEA